MDPLSEIYHQFSPYLYVGNDPIGYFDVYGLYRSKRHAERKRRRAQKKGYDVGEVYETSGEWGFSLGNGSHAFKRGDFGPIGGGIMNTTQNIMSVFGLILALGEPFDLVNAGIFGITGFTSGQNSHFIEAGLNAGSAIPFAGYAATGAKVSLSIVPVIGKISSGVKESKGLWKLAAEGATQIKRHPTFGKMYKDSKGLMVVSRQKRLW